MKDREALCATVHGVAKNLTQLSNWTTAHRASSPPRLFPFLEAAIANLAWRYHPDELVCQISHRHAVQIWLLLIDQLLINSSLQMMLLAFQYDNGTAKTWTLLEYGGKKKDCRKAFCQSIRWKSLNVVHKLTCFIYILYLLIHLLVYLLTFSSFIMKFHEQYLLLQEQFLFRSMMIRM